MEGVEISLDDSKGVVTAKPLGGITASQAANVVKRIEELLGNQQRRLLMVDLSRITPQNFPSNAVHRLSTVVRGLSLDKQAFVLNNPVLRTFANLVFKLSGAKHPFKFCETKEEAEAWLADLR